MPYPFGQTITVYRPGETSWNGDPLPGTSHTIPGCAIWPTSTTEVTQQRDTVTTGVTVLAPNGADIVATDRVFLPGEDPSGTARWQVDGAPFAWRSPLTGWAPGTEVRLKEVTG